MEGVNDDKDGLRNLEEYGLGTEPNDPDAGSAPSITLLDIGGETHVLLHATRRLGADDCALQPEAGSNLADWNSNGFEIMERGPNGDGTETIVWRTLAPQGPASLRFARLRFTIP